MKASALFLFVPLLAATALAQELTLSELASRPEFLPPQITIKQPIKLVNRPAFPVGTKLTPLAVVGTSVEVETPDGRTRFKAKADDTDVLAAAQATWKALTPPQRAITYASLAQRMDLWTYRVKVRQLMQFPGGELKPGEAAILVGFEGSNLLLVHERGKFLFNAEPRNTDLLESARKLVVDKKAFPSRVSEDLSGKLVHPDSGTATTLEMKDEPRYYLFYRGAGWCGPCRQFSPSLVKFYKEAKPKHPEFELIFMSADKSPLELKNYAKEIGFSWMTVPHTRQLEMQVANRLFSNLIPQLVVTDRSGAVVVDSAKIGTDAALKQFAALLKKG